MKYTILLTQECTLRCGYCYISKNNSVISRNVAKKTVEFIFRNTPYSEKIEVGFFGGEPLLEFDKLRFIAGLIEEKNKTARRVVEMQVISNGTILNDDISEFLLRHNIVYAVSCDGIPQAQDGNRLFPDGGKSSSVVEKNILKAINTFPFLMVNAVFTPSTYELLPDSVEYLYSLGLRKIYINADYSSKWSALDCEKIDSVFDELAGIYMKWYDNDDPAFLNIIDGKIIVLLEDGYKTNDKCRMGKAEFAFAPNGNIYPCERLLGDGSNNKHCIGSVFYPDNLKDPMCGSLCLALTQLECSKCSLKDYCANWCGCSNFLSTGFYNRTGPFICAVEKASINAGCKVFRYLDERFGYKTLEKITGGSCTGDAVEG